MASTGKRANPYNSNPPRDSAPTKRSRTAHACDSCRSRKSRCDGARPVCDLCAAMGLGCRYRGPAKQPQLALTTDHVFRLESRLQTVEQLLRQQMAVAADPLPPMATQDTDSLDHNWEDTQNDMTLSDPAAYTTTGDNFDTADDGVDGLAIISFRDEEVFGYFGPFDSRARLIIGRARRIDSCRPYF